MKYPLKFTEEGKQIKEEIDDNDDPWLTPRMADVFDMALYWELVFLDEDDDPESYLLNSLPAIARPYALIKEFRLALLDRARRLRLRLVKGL